MWGRNCSVDTQRGAEAGIRGKKKRNEPGGLAGYNGKKEGRGTCKRQSENPPWTDGNAQMGGDGKRNLRVKPGALRKGMGKVFKGEKRR